MRTVQIYSRHLCHFCEEALKTLKNLEKELNFEIHEIFIDGDSELEKKYGDQVPVIHIDHVHHDFFRVDPERLKRALHPHQ